MRWCWVNFQCWGVLLMLIGVGQGPTALAVGAGGGCLDIFSLVYHFSFLSPSLWETARYRLKYCPKGPFSPKQPTNPAIYKLILNYREKIKTDQTYRILVVSGSAITSLLTHSPYQSGDFLVFPVRRGMKEISGDRVGD